MKPILFTTTLIFTAVLCWYQSQLAEDDLILRGGSATSVAVPSVALNAPKNVVPVKLESTENALRLQNLRHSDVEAARAEEVRHDARREEYRDTEFLSSDGKARYFLSKEEIAERFPHGLPKEINVTENGIHTRFFHPNGKGTKVGEQKTLYLADRESLEKYQREVNEQNERYRQRVYAENSRKPQSDRKETFLPLEKDAFTAAFQPGFRGNDPKKLNKRIGVPNDLFERIRAVDFNLEIITEKDDPTDDEVRMITDSLVSLGHTGLITARLNGVAASADRVFEWAIYENAFDVKPENRQHHDKPVWYELAEVGISENGTDFKWLPCDHDNPLNAKESFCAGTTPSLRGGNSFTLGLFGKTTFKAIRALAVRDIGKNFHDNFYRPGAAGFDLDAIELKSAFVNER